jgi:hypothetical protein
MSSRNRGRQLAAAILAGVVSAGAAPAPPRVPYESPGVCPFECCTYRTWTVDADTDVLADRKDGAAVAFRLRRGQQVRGLTGVVVTTKLGRAVVRKPTVIGSETPIDVVPGDDILLLHYVGEGFWKFWIRGRIGEGEFAGKADVCTDEGREPVPCAVQIVEEPETIWWAKVRRGDGREGWTRQVDHFGNVDACG